MSCCCLAWQLSDHWPVTTNIWHEKLWCGIARIIEPPIIPTPVMKQTHSENQRCVWVVTLIVLPFYSRRQFCGALLQLIIHWYWGQEKCEWQNFNFTVRKIYHHPVLPEQLSDHTNVTFVMKQTQWESEVSLSGDLMVWPIYWRCDNIAEH